MIAATARAATAAALAAILAIASPATAQGWGGVAAPASGGAAPHVQTTAQAFDRDAAEYARQHGLGLDESARRLRAQEASVAATDRIAREFAGRLAGISIEHHPVYRIAVLLTGSAPVAGRTVFAGGMDVPIVFRTGAAATRERIAEAIVLHREAIRSALPIAQGMGVDLATGELVVIVRAALDPDEQAASDADLEALTGVPVRLRMLDGADVDLSLEGGSRAEGVDPNDGRRYVCTTGFVVTDAARTGIVTAAHCPDALTVYAPDGHATPLDFVGQWGVGYQDVQVHVGGESRGPTFYADASPDAVRTLTGARRRTSTRAGEAVCHRGEATGYSCSQVELVDYAPLGDLCAGPCDPVWTTVAGPSCRGGDSGGPIFNGTVAFGIAKGGSYGRSGRCGFYYYMSTDYLPDGWSLLFDSDKVDDDGRGWPR